MSISNYIKVIGRGKEGARSLSREQAADMFGQILDGTVSDLEIGAFCIAQRIKGETPDEVAGFLDATNTRMNLFDAGSKPVVVLPSYNGARKLPGLLPLLALLLARKGLPVLVHGTPTEDSRVYTSEVLELLGIPVATQVGTIAEGEVMFAPTSILSTGLQKLLDARRTIGLRNPAHSLVKMLLPVGGNCKSLLVTSYTHPEYASSMAQALALLNMNALLMRGTEGEPVADPRRTPKMQGFVRGQEVQMQAAQTGSIASSPELAEINQTLDAKGTADLIRKILDGRVGLPQPIAQQVEHIISLANAV